MRSEEWQRCVEIFSAALERQREQRAAFVDHACADDESLRRDVTMLLRSHEESGDFISAPAFVVPELLGDDPDALIGTHLGPYRLESVLGSGGMGVVYLARDERLGRKVGLKLLPQSLIADMTHLARLKREARTASALNHPNIVTIHDIGSDHSTHYIASELIEGETLRERLMRGPIQLSEAVDIATQVASALVAAHDAGVVHRDIKPENIMLRPDGYVKVLDFGIAKLAESAFADPAFAAASAEWAATANGAQSMTVAETNLGLILGTVRYMSPEQASGAPVDKRTDIWSLGVVLYEMITGHAPFTGETPREVMSAILEKEPSPLTNYIAHIPTELQQIISKTLRKNREERYNNAHDLLETLKALRRKLEFQAELKHSTVASFWLRWIRSPIALVLVLLIAAFIVALPFYRHRNLTTTPPPEKSIAVLPLENLSDEKENAFFADGIHDELLSNLSKIKDLKVISRTSVRQYKSGIPRNIREIGQQLGVAHVLEGTVQRTANRVKLSAQLIDARTDAHVWSQTYDRDLVDVFAIQSEIAKTIADQLHAKLSPAEKAAIAERPTTDQVAYAYYTEAINSPSDWEGEDKILNRQIELLEKVTQRDPNFALAYCALAKAHEDLGDVTQDLKHVELAKKAAEAAVRLRPDLGETHLALARNYFWAGIPTGEYDRARDELMTTLRMLPNNSEALLIAAKIDRHQNRWDSALTNLQKANGLDPNNGEIAVWLGQTYSEMRRYSEWEQLVKKYAANGTLKGPWIQVVLAKGKLAQGDPAAAQSLLEQVPLDFSPNEIIWNTRFKAALYLRDYDTADRVIAATPAKFADFAFDSHPSGWAEGLVARARGDKQKALAAFAAARKKLDAWWDDKPKDGSYPADLARLDAGLGRKEDAIREAQHAIDLQPIAKDSLNGPTWLANLALVYAWTGERDRALEQLETVATIPNGPTYGDLRFNPCWDDLRGDPRFDKIVAAAKAASRYALEPLPEKSIAVLPLENLSDEKENAFFAAGIHDELLSNLAKIADLKVISRTSVMQYKSGNPRNIREIGQQLGVAHVLEGSVQRTGRRVRVNVQLIDARNDTHLWAEHYDRDFADIFSIQSEIAERIAEQLRAKLSAAEKAAIAERPTADLVAYTYYTKANEINIYTDNWEGAEKNGDQKVELLEKATQRDPNFALAYCELAKTHGFLGDGAERRKHLDLGKTAAETAVRMRPDLAEAHLALARYYFMAGVETDTDNYDRAREELAIVRRKLPNNAEALMIEALIGRHQNRWDASLANLQRASELDPRNTEVAYRLEQIYFEMRRYSEFEQLIRKDAATADYSVEHPFIQTWLAQMKLAQGDAVAAQSLLEQVPFEYSVWGTRFMAAFYLRDYDAANRVIAATPAKHADDAFGTEHASENSAGLVARARGDKEKAVAFFAIAREKLEAKVADNHSDASPLADLAIADAGLGRKEEAIREGRQAVEIQPITKDSLNGPRCVRNLALVYAWTGDRDRALEQLEKVATLPGYGPTYGDLLLNPCWDELRGDPRFERIVAAAKAASR
jgi:TolB-like protein/predicted Zn-dependent protease